MHSGNIKDCIINSLQVMILQKFNHRKILDIKLYLKFPKIIQSRFNIDIILKINLFFNLKTIGSLDNKNSIKP